jgi:hypothetical protein
VTVECTPVPQLLLFLGQALEESLRDHVLHSDQACVLLVGIKDELHACMHASLLLSVPIGHQQPPRGECMN